MKKLMIVAAAAMGLAAFGDIESSNIVGYANAENTVDQFNFLSVGFNSVGYNTIDLQQLRLNGSDIGWGEETVAVWAGAPEVVDGSDFFYYDPSMDPEGTATDFYWGDADCVKANFTIAPGQAVVVQCGEGIEVVACGQVPMETAEMTTVEGFNFVGNPFPLPIDVQTIKIVGDDIGWGEETFAIWAGAPEVVDGSDFFYYDPSMDPEGEAQDYYWGDSDCVPVTYTIGVGQGTVIQCGADLTVKIAPPYVK